ncbi:retrotransposon protein, putative, ty1-copia subclass, partial [Tanacetum coccineum]
RKMVNELHVMLKIHEQTLPKKDAPTLLAIRAGKVYDTGCGTHISNTTQGLWGSRKLKPGPLSLYMGNGQHAAVEAIGYFHLCLLSGLVLILHNCYYAPSITRGIISVSCLYDDGFINHFEDNAISVFRNNLVYFCAVPRDGIYEIDFSNSNTNDSSMYAVSNKRAKLNLDSALLWHYRLGHINKKRIEKLQHDGLLNSTNIENQLEKTIKLLYSDREGEYMCQEFLDHLKEHEIIAHRTPPYTPQHNDVSERRNKTLLDMVCSMISQTPLPKSFWDYALEFAAHILNKVPTKKVEKTPYEEWLFNKKTSMDGAVHTYKARLVAKGFTQTYRVDYEETFSPVADIRSIRILMAIVAFYDYEIWQMDVKTAFLNGHLS